MFESNLYDQKLRVNLAAARLQFNCLQHGNNITNLM